LPFITTWDDSRNQNHPTDSAEEATNPGSQKPFMAGAVSVLPDLCFVGGAAGTQCLPFYRYEDGRRTENITDWAVDKFRDHYGSNGRKKITKEAIFQYVYAVLHDPIYRDKYVVNLKRELPRIPFYGDFWAWAKWGKVLLEVHLGYADAKPAPLKRVDTRDSRSRDAGVSVVLILRADKEHGTIEVDAETTLTGIPQEAWGYRLGNRCALEWVLDQHKEKNPKDPTSRDKFNFYRFEDYKESIIDLIRKVTTVSIETVEIVRAMKKAPR
jgi:predicted helicase